ncbi:MAG: hypothetical protein CV090_09840, partial [Nitrospira sp. WS238]|nr:hypothetical protein [Nitrospira sp. WS238]
MTQSSWQDVLSRGLGEALLTLTFLLIAFLVWLLLKKLGFIGESIVDAWSLWDRWSQSLSHGVLLWLLAIVILGLFVILDSR